MSRKFMATEHFAAPESSYHLLPFRFHPISDEREVIVSEVGDYVVCPRGTAARVARRELRRDEPLYADLLGRFVISEEPLPAMLDTMATRYRTKKAFLDAFTALHIFVVTLRCNHTCHYCQVSRQTEDRSGFDMRAEDLDRAVDLMFMSPSQELTIDLLGLWWTAGIGHAACAAAR